MTQPSNVLGYHIPGDYHFFISVADADRMLGAGDERFQDPAALVGLVTGMHEHVHLMQSRMSGFCLWLEEAKDKVVACVGYAASEARGAATAPLWDRPDVLPTSYTSDGSAFSNAICASYERDYAEQLLIGANVTEMLLNGLAADWPMLCQLFLDEAWTLTALDLLEAQAAMVAELQLERLVSSRPERFDLKTFDKVSEIFRIASLPEAYGKALRIITHLFDRMGIAVAPETEGVAARIPQGEFYPLVIYLLDYALHTPPDLFALRASFNNDAASFQDIHPPFRFLMLSLFLALEVAGGQRSDDDLRDYYGATDGYLAGIINAAHEAVRNPEDRSVWARAQWPKSFYTIRETTDQWLAHVVESSGSKRYRLLSRVDQSSLEFRKDRGFGLYLGDLLDIHTGTGLPIVRETPKGVRALPFFRTDGTVSDEEAKRQAEAFLREFYAGPDWDAPVTDTPTANPWPFLQQAADRRIDQDSARLLFEGGPVRCPLTIRMGRYLPCGPRRLACENITSIDRLPTEGCRMLQRITDLEKPQFRESTQTPTTTHEPVFDNYTDRARSVVVLAQEEARMLNHNYVGAEHILLGLLRQDGGVAATALESVGISLDTVRQQVEEIIGQIRSAPSGNLPFTPRAIKVLELSMREADQLGHNYVGTEHILLGLIREGDSVGVHVLVKLGVDLNAVRQQVIQQLA